MDFIIIVINMKKSRREVWEEKDVCRGDKMSTLENTPGQTKMARPSEMERRGRTRINISIFAVSHKGSVDFGGE